MIIDAHTHLNNYDEDRVAGVDGRRDELLAELDRHGVDHAIILTSYKVNEHRPSTRQVVESIDGHPNLSVVAGISLENYDIETLHELREFLQGGKVIGLKLYPGYEPYYPYDERCRVVYDTAAEFEVPVMIHTGDTYAPNGKLRYSHPLNVDDVAVDYPEVKFVICHLGNPWIMDCMEVVYKNANAYTDVSGLVSGRFKRRFKHDMIEHVREGITYAGTPDRLLYGTDWPICDMGSYLGFMRDLHLADDVREMVMWRNAAALFKLPIAGASAEHKAA